MTGAVVINYDLKALKGLPCFVAGSEVCVEQLDLCEPFSVPHSGPLGGVRLDSLPYGQSTAQAPCFYLLRYRADAHSSLVYEVSAEAICISADRVTFR